MKSKLPIMVIFSLLVFFSLGCISEVSPDTSDVDLNPDNPSVTFSAITDNKHVTWTLDGKETEQERADDGKVSLTLNYSDLSVGDHVLILQDSDSSPHEWKLHVSRQGKSNDVTANTGHATPSSWNDRYEEWIKRENEIINTK